MGSWARPRVGVAAPRRCSDGDRSKFQHPPFYERISIESEQRGTAERQDAAFAGLAGQVIEVGAGNGLNFAPLEGGMCRES